MRTPTIIVPVLTLTGAIAAAVAGFGAPRPTGDHGDEHLAARTRAHFGSDRGVAAVSVVEVSASSATWAGLGGGTSDGSDLSERTPFQLGSITKTFTGMLLADALERGEVRPDQRLGTIMTELDGTDAGDVTLEELSTHRSGLPRLLPGDLIAGLRSGLTLRNPYTVSVDDMINGAREVSLDGRGQFAYSNLGVALLGHALARAADVDSWDVLVRERLWRPLGMNDTVVARTPEDIPVGAIVLRTDAGARPEPWTNAANAPAGCGIYTTAADMGAFVRAIVEGRAPGMAALDPRADTGDGDRVGLAWFVVKHQEREITWHNGGVAGGTSMLALDRETGRGVVVLASTDRSMDEVGMALLVGETAGARPQAPVRGLVITVVGLLLLGTLAWTLKRPSTVSDVVTTVLLLAAQMVLVARVGPWTVVPGWVFGALVGLSTGVALAVMRSWRTTTSKPQRWWGWLGVLFGVTALGLVLSGVWR